MKKNLLYDPFSKSDRARGFGDDDAPALELSAFPTTNRGRSVIAESRNEIFESVVSSECNKTCSYWGSSPVC